MENSQVNRTDMVEFLCGTALFKGIDKETVAEVLPLLHGRVIVVPADHVFLAGGEKIDQIQVIMRGEMVVSKLMESGEENLIEKLRPGYMVNAAVACSPSQINPFYVHSTQEAEIFEFPFGRLFRETVLPEPVRTTLFQNIIFHLANDNIRRQKKIDVLSVNSLRDRIIIYLETRSLKLRSDEFLIPFNREEMANYLCVNRSALSHELSLMRQEGLIEFRKNSFKLLKK